MGYTSERNNQIVIELLKYHGIRKIVASPGATNVSFVASVQQDEFFEIYSSVDERSAAYIACGLAAESGEPVVLSCTGATASRNYFPGLTEAYYRKLPILAITSTMPISRIGHNIPQVIDRTNVTNDIARLSVHIPMVKDNEDEWNCTVRVNEAILELNHRYFGPVHMNVETTQGGTFDVNNIQPVRPIDRIRLKDGFLKKDSLSGKDDFSKDDDFPAIEGKKVAIFVGAHAKWTSKLTQMIDAFCEKYNAVVIGDHTSNYRGKYSVPASLVTNQKYNHAECTNIDLLIHIGDISGSYLNIRPSTVWRVNSDGKICDTFRALRYVFEMDEYEFFEKYNAINSNRNNVSSDGSSTSYYESWRKEYDLLTGKIPEIPFSNLWIAKQLSHKLPDNSILHLGILNSLRSWNFFEIPNSVLAYSNTGGFGIDGCLSTILGTALATTDQIIYGVLGDLAFFYDMNALGNRHLNNNIRLLVVNNGHGQEFRNYGHRASQFGEKTDKYIAAAGHYGNKSDSLIRNYVEALGFRYLSAKNKKTFLDNMEQFISSEKYNEPLVFEIFTENDDETNALKVMTTLNETATENVKQMVKSVIRDKGVKAFKKILKD